MMELHICDSRGKVLKAFALGDESEIIVGRDDSCDIRIAAPTISREHCAIEKDGDEMFLRDLDSAGGTIMGGSRVQRVRLEDGMEVNIGPAVLKFFAVDL